MVRAQRRRLGLTQEELADAAGVSVRGLAKIESGQVVAPRPSTVRLLADGLGLAGADRDGFCRGAVPRSAPTVAPDPTDGPGLIAAAASTAGHVVPAQLPPDVSGFTGRERELAELERLPSAGPYGIRPAVAIAVISGPAGVGKSALAVHWAQRSADRFPDGQLYVDLRGFSPGGQATDPVEVVRGFLDALGVPGDRVPPGLAAQAGLYRSLVSGRRMLIVLDNARDADQVRPLLPGTPTVMVVVTSRDRLTSLIAAVGAYPLTLDVMSTVEAGRFLDERLGRPRVAAEPDAATRIITACARLPLALAVVAARARQTGFSLAAVAADIDQVAERLDALDSGDPNGQVRTALSWSYATLSPDSARLFRLLGLHPGPDISRPAAASLAGLTVPATRRLLDELSRSHLLTERTPGRYAFHDLLRAYAADLARRRDPARRRRLAIRRLLDHYTHTACAGHRLLSPARDPIDVGPPHRGVTPEPLADDRRALAWFTAEHSVLLAAADLAATAGFHVHAGQLAATLAGFLYRNGNWRARATVARAALSAARRAGDPAAQAQAHRLLAGSCNVLSDFQEAHEHLDRALDLYRHTGDLAGQAQIHENRVLIYDRQGRHREALDDARRALELFQAVGHRRGQARAHNAVGWCHAMLGDHARARGHCERALALFQGVGDTNGEADTWDSLGYAHRNLGHHDQAVACYQRALDLIRDIGDRYREATTLTYLGDAHDAAADHDAARAAWQRAMEILDELDHPDGAPVRARLDRRALGASTARCGS
jgi:tetratricopeptide (TPR) repeat protein/transcriptional regulator with XRE-family HTH domain